MRKNFCNFVMVGYSLTRVTLIFWLDDGAAEGPDKDNGACLVITFNADHTLGFPSNIYFYPDERFWEFDEKEQLVIFKDKTNQKIVSRFKLPAHPDPDYFILSKVTDVTARYIAYKGFDFNRQITQPPVLASQRVLLMGEAQAEGTKAQLEKYATENCCEIRWLKVGNADLWQLIEQAWNVVTDDLELKAACLLLDKIPAKDEVVLTAGLRLEGGDKQTKLIAGSRAQVLVVLSQLLIMHYQQMLAGADLQSPLALMSKVVKK